MAQTRLLYLTATRATQYRWLRGDLHAEGSFPNSEEGIAAFSAQLISQPYSLFHLLVDVVEEDFHIEMIPFVRGTDRRALLARRIAQRYRDTSLSAAISLGTERTQRRDEKLLLSSFTNTQQFQPWLEALRQREIAVSGVYSPALLAPQLARGLGRKKAPLLIVSVQQAGIRQSYLENGKLRFSRLSPLGSEELGGPDRIAATLERETTRVYQYLSATRVVATDRLPLDVLMIAPPGDKARVQAVAPTIPQLRVQVVDQLEVARRIGLRGAANSLGGEALYLHLLAKRRPPEQYAADSLRTHYRLHEWRVGLIAGGAVIGSVCLLIALVQLMQAHLLRDRIAQDQHETRVAADAHGRVTATFPKLPTSAENFRATMEQYARLLKLTTTPDRLAVDISRALATSPNIELDRINWKVDGAPGAPKAGANPPVGGVAPSGERFEIAEISGRLLGARASDYRAITAQVNEFVERLGKSPDVQIISVKMPFDVGSQTSLSGDVGLDRSGDAPRFSVTLARKVGA